MASNSSHTARSATSKRNLQGSHRSLQSQDETEATTITDDDYSAFEEDDDYLDDIEEALEVFAKRRVRRTVSADDTLHRMRQKGAVAGAGKYKSLKRAVTLSERRGTKEAQEEVRDRIDNAATTNGYFQDPNPAPCDDSPMRPDKFLQEALHGLSATTFASKTWEPYFTHVTEERIAAHKVCVSRAIRSNDIDSLRQLHNDYQKQQGESTVAASTPPLDGCNSHGESMIHLACRLGNARVVKFLMEEAGVSVKVRDDQGKTPLHDVFWSNKPNFDLVRYIVNHSPELLFISDYRDFSALHYIPTACWQEWCDWIEANASWILEKVKDSTWLRVQNDLDTAQQRMQRLLAKAASAMEES